MAQTVTAFVSAATESSDELLSVFLDCCDAFFSGDLKLDAFLEGLRTPELSKEQKEGLIDGLFLQGYERTEKDQKKLYFDLLRAVADNPLPRDVMKTHLDMNLLQECGLVEAGFVASYKKYTTSKLYTQDKYNLFRECSEGYSKLVTFLTELQTNYRHATVADVPLSTAANTVQALIGHFKLDPYRVSAAILSALESDVENPWLLHLTTTFATKATTLLGFQFRQYQKPCVLSYIIDTIEKSKHQIKASTLTQFSDLSQSVGVLKTKECQDIFKMLKTKLASTEANVTVAVTDACKKIVTLANNEKTELTKAGVTQIIPHAMYNVAAKLIKDGYVKFSEIYNFLGPDESILQAQGTAYLQAKIAEAGKVGHVNLTASGASQSQSGAVTPLPFDLQDSETELPPFLANETNQKLNLIISLLKLDAYEHAIQALESFEFPDAMAYEPLRKAATKQLEALLDPLYPVVSLQYFLLEPNTKPPEPSPKDLATFDDYAFPLARLIGSQICKDPTVMTKLSRILRHLLIHKSTKHIHNTVEAICVECFLPGIHLTSPNPGLLSEVWGVMELLHYEQRFRLYGTFLHTAYEAPNHRLLYMRQHTQTETSRVCKRIAKDSTKAYGRVLAKITHCNPFVAFEKVLEQCMAYDNLIICLVEMCRYVTHLGMDILIYEVMVQMTKLSSETYDAARRMKLLNLGNFVGQFFKKYHTQVDLEPLLMFIVKSIRQGETLHLPVLTEIMKNMTAMQDLEGQINEQQLEAHTGGPILCFIAGGIADMLRAQTATSERHQFRASRKLREKLFDSRLAQPLLMLLAQLRDEYLLSMEPDFGADKLPFMAAEQDNIGMCFNMLLQYLTINHPKESWAALVEKAEIRSKRAVMLDPVTNAQMADGVDDESDEEPMVEKEYTALDIPKYCDLVSDFSVAPPAGFALIRPKLPIRPIFKTEDIHKHLGDLPKIVSFPTNVLNQHLYCLFWTMDLYDIYVPTQRYEETLKKLKEEHKAAATKTRTSDFERKEEDIRSLQSEWDNHTKTHEAIKKKLQEYRAYEELVSKENMFKNIADRVWLFLQECILPRCILSTLDAIYCGKFIEALHALGLPNCSTINLISQLLQNIPYWIVCLTEAEAKRVGRFLSIVLKLLLRWRTDEKLYDKECGKSPGFRNKPEKPDSNIPFDVFRQAHYKLHMKLCLALKKCLDGDEILKQRNSLYVLGEIKDAFPLHSKTIGILNYQLSTMRDRQGVKTLVDAYYTILQRKKPHDIDKEDCKYAIDQDPPKKAAVKKVEKATKVSSTPASETGTSSDKKRKREEEQEATTKESKDKEKESKPADSKAKAAKPAPDPKKPKIPGMKQILRNAHGSKEKSDK